MYSDPVYKNLDNGLDSSGFVSWILLNARFDVGNLRAFIDIGLHNDALVNVSKTTNKYIKHPSEVLSARDIVKCYVIDINKEKEKVSLSLINPNN